MARLHLFEFEDQSWFPGFLRRMMTDYLAFTAKLTTAPFVGFTRKLKEALEKTGDRELVDLCSGGGGPLPQVVKLLKEREGLQVRAKFTDLYPNIESLERMATQMDSLSVIKEPVDATAVPSNLKGFRTMFNSFHHFSPEMGRKILEDAVRSRQGIAVLELVSRSPLGILSVASLLIAMPLLTPLIRPFRVARLIFTYLIPLVPLVSLWDGFVSCLRVYSPRELDGMIQGLGDQGQAYEWDTGRLKLEKGPGYVTYLLGVPKGNSGAAPAS